MCGQIVIVIISLQNAKCIVEIGYPKIEGQKMIGVYDWVCVRIICEICCKSVRKMDVDQYMYVCVCVSCMMF